MRSGPTDGDQMRDATPVSGRSELSEIAYGFMASKALFAALELDLFSRLAAGPQTASELTDATGVAPNRMRTLLHALTGLGLVVPDGSSYANAPACQRYLVRGAPDGFGEYYRLQIARQIYPALLHLDAGLMGTGTAFDTYSELLSTPERARTFTAAQHAGSLGAAKALGRRVALNGAARLLDVGGGSGAFSISLCQQYPGLHATVLDFAAVIDVAREYRAEAGLAERIDLVSGDAVHTTWPDAQDVVLMSYLLSALDEEQIDVVLAKAHACLRPGGLLVVHDFMLDDDELGPRLAALWFLQYVVYRPDTVSFSAASLSDRLRSGGFTPVSSELLIPEITKVVLAHRVDR